MIEIATMLPWPASVALALISYFGFQTLAQLPPIATASNVPGFANTIASSMFRQMVISVASILQYIAPLAFLVGALVGWLRQRKQGQLFSHVADRPNRQELERMSWEEFEQLTAEVFRRKGYTVKPRGGRGPDGGVDLELAMGKDRYLVQCKQWKAHQVGVSVVRELFGVMAAEGAVGGYVVASGSFTEEARKFAEGREIRLVSSDSLLASIRESQPKRGAGDPACPLCGGAMVMRVAKRGSNVGKAFWGCARYPDCKGTVSRPS